MGSEMCIRDRFTIALGDQLLDYADGIDTGLGDVARHIILAGVGHEDEPLLGSPIGGTGRVVDGNPRGTGIPTPTVGLNADATVDDISLPSSATVTNPNPIATAIGGAGNLIVLNLGQAAQFEDLVGQTVSVTRPGVGSENLVIASVDVPSDIIAFTLSLIHI